MSFAWLVEACTFLFVVALVAGLPAARVALQTDAARCPPELARASDWERVRDLEHFYTVRWARENLPKDALVLAFRAAEFPYYAQRRIIRNLDPRLIPIYAMSNADEAHRALLALGIEWVYLPYSYADPTIYNSIFDEILGRPRFVSIVAQDSLYRICRLHASPRRVAYTPYPIPGSDCAPGAAAWRHDRLGEGQSAALRTTPKLRLKLSNQQKTALRFATGTVEPSDWDTACPEKDRSARPLDLRVEATIQGNGLVSIKLQTATPDGAVALKLIDTVLLREEARVMTAVIQVPAGHCARRLVVTLHGRGDAVIEDLVFRRID